MRYSLWYNAPTMLPASSLEAEVICYTGLLTACEQEQLLLLTSFQQTCIMYNLRFQATDWQHRGCIIPQAVTHKSSAPEDGRDCRPKHVQMNGIINKPLLLHLFGCLYYFYPDVTFLKRKLPLHFFFN